MPRLRTPLVWRNNRAVIDDDLAQHVWKILGIPPGVFHAWVDLCYPPGSLRHDLIAKRAFDNAHGTNTSQSDTFDLNDLPDFVWESYAGPFTMAPDHNRVVHLHARLQ